jgi:F0F1-type ATP synthase membrane subunit c/vacuolar-type H+-ATPase subunit K
MAFTFKPLWVIFAIGSVSFLFGLIGGVVVIIRSSTYDVTLTMSGLILFSVFLIGGLVILSTGILGGYIARISSESQNRPRYIVREKIGFSE